VSNRTFLDVPSQPAALKAAVVLQSSYKRKYSELPTPRWRIVLEKLEVPQLVKKFK